MTWEVWLLPEEVLFSNGSCGAGCPDVPVAVVLFRFLVMRY